MRKCYYYFCVVSLCFQFVIAQVGIGTIAPNASSVLDVESTTGGILLPRMTTVERNAIDNPANGLTVFDTDTQNYYFYDATLTEWESLNSSRLNRDNYVLVKSQSDFPEASAGTITLDTNTYYEINGIVVLDTPIVMNGAYIAGLDATQDVLSKTSGNVFEGSGGSIRNVSITGGSNVFSINSGASLLVQNCIISGMADVGTVSGVGFVFLNNVQYLNNTNGIEYSNISNLLLNNQAWHGDNSGTFEKFTGSFDLIGKASGFSIVNAAAVAIDVSANPTVGDAIIDGTVFSGTSSSFINNYTGLPTGHNFTKEWFVQAAGIDDEYDDIATGDFYYDGSLTTGYSESITDNTAFKLSGNTNSSNLLRFSSAVNNRLTYLGKDSRTFRINASLSVRGIETDGIFYTFFVRKNGTETLTETNSIFYVDGFLNVNSMSITGTVNLEPDDYIEIWCQRLTGSGSSGLVVFSQNLSID
ncbi:hypothetical protein [Flavobacteriaceae bacterium 14752]|uniref:hypothetical protein n=1 Tax=Mesohalobacter salilacus TaxID=2491711 RepID=UPI000F636989|nr:hypothetical protein EIG84_05205 [Flavobacteriaceae bacterium 14752]